MTVEWFGSVVSERKKANGDRIVYVQESIWFLYGIWVVDRSSLAGVRKVQSVLQLISEECTPDPVFALQICGSRPTPCTG